MSKNFLNNHSIRGIRNNNPGNLIKTSETWLGKIVSADSRFEQFVNMKYGVRALLKNLVTQITKRNNNTLTKLLTVFAPEFENDTAAYIAAVSKLTGLTANQVLGTSKAELIAVAKAIIYVECTKVGYDLLSDADYNEAYNAMGETKVTSSSKNMLLSILIPVTLFFYTIGAFTGLKTNDLRTSKTYKNVTKIQNVVCHK